MPKSQPNSSFVPVYRFATRACCFTLYGMLDPRPYAVDRFVAVAFLLGQACRVASVRQHDRDSPDVLLPHWQESAILIKRL